MPKLTDRFGPIPSSVVLNGAGNGQVTFQSNGGNARITNLYVNVSTSTLQAECVIYKGQVAPSNIIDSTNSGSTGASAKGAIDLMDGETLFVVWTGGDAGATAYVTFTGVVVPFEQIGASGITWSDPIAAGDGSLIYPQIKSPDYVAGVSGWAIFRNGNVEFNNATIRGEVIAGGGNVVLDLHGVTVTDIGGTAQYQVNRTGGFVATNIPDNGAKTQIFVAGMVMIPSAGNPTPGGATVLLPARVSTLYVTGANEQEELQLQSGQLSGGGNSAVVRIRSADSANVSQPYIELDARGTTGSVVELNAEFVTIPHKMRNTFSGMFYCPMQLATASAAVVGVNSLSFAHTFPTPFPVGSQVWMFCNLTSAAGASSGWYARAFSITNTGCTISVRGPAVGTFTADVDYAAFVIPS